MQIFSPDGQYGYVCSSFTLETVVITVQDHQIVGRIPQEAPFCPNIAVTPDGGQVWLTLKDVGKTMVFSGRAPFAVLKTDRKSTRLNSSHGYISYAVFCLKKKKKNKRHTI